VIVGPPASWAGTVASPRRVSSSQFQSLGNHSFASPTATSSRLPSAPRQAAFPTQDTPYIANRNSQTQPPDVKNMEKPEEYGDEARGPREDRMRKPKLWPNFVDFFNDNVNMMVMAATLSSFASGLAGQALGPSAGPIMLAQATMVLCFMLVSILRSIGLLLYRRESDDSIARLVYGTMLKGLPWFLRVPTVIVIPSYLQAIYDYLDWNPSHENAGQATPAFVASIVVFLIMFSLLVYLGSVMRSHADAADPDAAWSTFFLQSLYVSAMSGAGKAMHYTIRVPMLTMAGPVDINSPVPPWQELRVLFVMILVMTAVAWFFLSSTLPNQMDNPQLAPFQQLQLQCQQYVVVYTWAFATVDAGWIFLYSYVGGSLVTSYYIGMLLFLCWLAITLGAACVLAVTTPDNSFDDMGKGNKKKAAACLMNYWLVDFITWWMQAQVVTSLDTDVADMSLLGRMGNQISSSWAIIGANFAVLLLALFVVGGVHACNHEALKVSAYKRIRDQTMSHLRKQDREDADEDDSVDSDGSD